MIRIDEPLRTVEDLEALPDDVRAELINGELVMMSATMTHSLICGSLYFKIRSFFENQTKLSDKDDWVIVPEAWINYDNHNSFVHDLAGFYRKDLINRPEHGPIKTKPFWACEVLSPSNWSNDTQKKRVILEHHQVPFYWIVDPVRKTIQVLELKNKNEHYQIIYAADIGDGKVKLAPFSDLELNLSDLFSDVITTPRRSS